MDSRLATEFFKHLPGLFTGVGIIGTFWGLIQGLQAFKVSDDSGVVRTSLQGLMHHVSEAFLVSATAIIAAMVATFVEKMLVTALYRQAEKLAFELDSMFESGAGEEYLARLVKASEDSADQSKLLKDALVTDLDRILSSLTERQIQAQAQGSQDLAKQFIQSLTVGLQEPLERITETFRQTSQGNSQAVTGLLTDVLAGFSQRLEELFGGQITGINQLQQQTIQALQAAVTKLDQMASNVETAGTRTSETMGQRLADAISGMEARQNIMNERMTEFVEQIRSLVRESQSETSQKLQTTLTEIGEAVRAQISALKDQGDQASASHSEREGRIAAQTQDMLRQLGSQVDAAIGSLQALSERATTAQLEREQRMATQVDDTVAKLGALTERPYAMSVAMLAVTKSIEQVKQKNTELQQTANALSVLQKTPAEIEIERQKAERDHDIDKLLGEVVRVAGRYPGIKIDKGQNIIDFGDRAHFDKGKHTLTSEQARLLRAFVPEILAIARDELGRKWLKRVVVEGFASPEGDYLYNLNLSLQRSQRVLCVLLAQPYSDEHAMTQSELEQIRDLFLVGGYSFNAAKFNSITASYDESRRVELRLEFLGIGESRPSTEAAPRGSFGQCALGG